MNYYAWITTLPFSDIYNELILYVQYTKNQAVKKWLPFKLICAVYLEYIVTIHFVCPYPNILTLYVQWYTSWNDLVWSVNQKPSHQKVASTWAYMCSILRVNINHSLCLSIPQFTYLLCSVHQDPSHQKVASIWTYMCSIHSNLKQLTM